MKRPAVSLSFLGFLLLLSDDCNGFAAQKTKRSSGAGFGGPKVKQAYDPDQSAATKAFIKFVKSQKGAKVDAIDIGFNKESGRRGLFAAKTFGKEGAMICRIPSDAALALTDPADPDAAPTMAHRGANLITMYDQKKKGAWFRPYLDMLPKNIENSTPSLWTEEEIDLLEFPRLVTQAKERRKEIQEYVQANDVSLDQLEYATWLVSSRAFPVRLRGEDEAEEFDDMGQVIAKVSSTFVPVLVPLIDMANHHSSQPNAKLTIIDPEKDEAFFALTSTRPIQAGKEILIGYGSGVDSSVELLLNYGFVPAHSNPIDKFMLKKGGDDCISDPSGWTTTLEEDRNVLALLDSDDAENDILRKILCFRIRLKEAYGEVDDT